MTRTKPGRGDTMTLRHDTGCPDGLIEACLSCPLPQCRYELAPKQAKALVDAETLRGLLRGGLTADECAEQMGVSRRSIYRLKLYAATTATIALPLR